MFNDIDLILCMFINFPINLIKLYTIELFKRTSTEVLLSTTPPA
jgi:hypothetical protein